MMNNTGFKFLLFIFILKFGALLSNAQTGQVVNNTDTEVRASIPSHLTMIFPNNSSKMISVNSVVNNGISNIPFIIQSNITPLTLKLESQSFENIQNDNFLFFLIQDQKLPAPINSDPNWNDWNEIFEYKYEIKGAGEHKLNLWVKTKTNSLPESDLVSNFELILYKENKKLASHNIKIESKNTK